MTERPTNDDLEFARVIGRLEQGMQAMAHELEAARADLKITNQRLDEMSRTLNATVTGHKVLWGVATVLGGAVITAATLFAGYFNSKGHP